MAWDRDGASRPRADLGADQTGTPFNDLIASEIRSIFGDEALPIERVLYAPDDAEDPFDEAAENPRGRALVQYQPASSTDCSSRAQWRVWFERQADAPQARHEWDPLLARGDDGPAQTCSDPSERRRRGVVGRRQACSRSSASSSTSTPTTRTTSRTTPTTIGTTTSTTSSTTKTTTSTTSSTTTTSKTTTTTPTPDPTPTSPLEAHDVVCNNEDDYRGHGDISAEGVLRGALYACGDDSGLASQIGASSANKPPFSVRTTFNEIHYDWVISWDYGCTTTVASQDPRKPLGDGGPECFTIMSNNYYNCNNGGVGGVTQVGCLFYRFNGGLG